MVLGKNWEWCSCEKKDVLKYVREKTLAPPAPPELLAGPATQANSRQNNARHWPAELHQKGFCLVVRLHSMQFLLRVVVDGGVHSCADQL